MQTVSLQKQYNLAKTEADSLIWCVAVIVAIAHVLMLLLVWSQTPDNPVEAPPEMLMIDLNTMAQLEINNTPTPIVQATAQSPQIQTPPQKQQQLTAVPKFEPEPKPEPKTEVEPDPTSIKPKLEPAAQLNAVQTKTAESSGETQPNLKQPEEVASVQPLAGNVDKLKSSLSTINAATDNKVNQVVINTGTSALASSKNNLNDALIPATHIGGHLNNPRPTYPVVSRDNGEEGSVELRVQVSKEGRAESVDVVKSSGFRRLDRCAKSAAANYHFRPATKGGVPIPFSYNFAINFRLSDS